MVPLEGWADKFRLQQFPLGVSELLFAPQVVLDLAQGVSSRGVGQENLSAKRHYFQNRKAREIGLLGTGQTSRMVSPYGPV